MTLHCRRCGGEVAEVELRPGWTALGHKSNPKDRHHYVRLARAASVPAASQRAGGQVQLERPDGARNGDRSGLSTSYPISGPGPEPSGMTPVRAADGSGATSSDGGSPETERATALRGLPGPHSPSTGARLRAGREPIASMPVDSASKSSGQRVLRSTPDVPPRAALTASERP